MRSNLSNRPEFPAHLPLLFIKIDISKAWYKN
jgi:hypothetical protein